MPKYNVTLCDERHYYATVTIHARDEREAQARAVTMGYDKSDKLEWKWEDGNGIWAAETEKEE